MLQICTKMNGFKFDFSKIFWGGGHRAPSPDPFPRFFSGFALGLGFTLNSRALRTLDSGFALDTRALRAVNSGFALSRYKELIYRVNSRVMNLDSVTILWLVRFYDWFDIFGPFIKKFSLHVPKYNKNKTLSKQNLFNFTHENGKIFRAILTVIG